MITNEELKKLINSDEIDNYLDENEIKYVMSLFVEKEGYFEDNMKENDEKIVTIKEELEKLINCEYIAKYLDDSEKNYLIELFEDRKVQIEKSYKHENNKERIAAVVLYNLIDSKVELRNRKMSNGKKYVFSWEYLSEIVKVSERTLREKNKIFLSRCGKFNKFEIQNDFGDKIIKSLVSDLKKYRNKVDNQELSDSELRNIFAAALQSVKSLYIDKKSIRIKEFLIYLQANMILKGYTIEMSKLEQRFSELYKDLQFDLTEGVDEDDFVSIKDSEGNYCNMVFIEFCR